jgi:hypothetical protein
LKHKQLLTKGEKMLAYNLVRSNDLSSREFHFLSIVDSFSNESHLKLKDYAEIMRTSIRTLKRVVKSLREKGYIQVRYGLYKSLHIAVSTRALWKPNTGKPKSKGPKWSVKRAKGDSSNIERNKEINKGVIYPIFKAETAEYSTEMPQEAKSMLENLKSRLGIK